MDNIPYASLVKSLMYTQSYTKLDISFAVGMLGCYKSNHGLVHWRAANKVLRYLQGTKDHMLTYRTSNLEVVGYSDSDYVGCSDTRKSTFDYMFLLADRAVSWKSGIVGTIAKLMKMYYDNAVAILFSKNDRYSKGSKHMNLKYLFVKEDVQNQRVQIVHIDTNDMSTDPLTKGLTPKTFIGHVSEMGVVAKSLYSR
ncbi:secreted RxLR effector protein 161-like [Hibiscus syriacus]|uniref:secreted RxLR effector protein 161-like n=1 Tax=Hibiscus syriacus TaxID=106335 RepID=UPI001922F30B|nr:secreted RxLR effector protein 161-like [Hibiscus syriacus]